MTTRAPAVLKMTNIRYDHTNELTNIPILGKNLKSIDSISFFPSLKVNIVSGIQ